MHRVQTGQGIETAHARKMQWKTIRYTILLIQEYISSYIIILAVGFTRLRSKIRKAIMQNNINARSASLM